MNEQIYKYIADTVNNLDKIVQYFSLQEKTREQEIAMQKLEEAIFWLTYGLEEIE